MNIWIQVLHRQLYALEVSFYDFPWVAYVTATLLLVTVTGQDSTMAKRLGSRDRQAAENS